MSQILPAFAQIESDSVHESLHVSLGPGLHVVSSAAVGATDIDVAAAVEQPPAQVTSAAGGKPRFASSASIA